MFLCRKANEKSNILIIVLTELFKNKFLKFNVICDYGGYYLIGNYNYE